MYAFTCATMIGLFENVVMADCVLLFSMPLMYTNIHSLQWFDEFFFSLGRKTAAIAAAVHQITNGAQLRQLVSERQCGRLAQCEIPKRVDVNFDLAG